jgi:hypothetical protein
MVVQQTGLAPAKALDLIESILIYLKVSVPPLATVDLDQVIAEVRRQDAEDPFNKARSTFFGGVDTSSGLDN